MEYYVENIKGAVNHVYKDQKAFGQTLTLTFTMPNKDMTLFLNLDDGVRNIYIGKEVELEHGSVTVNNSAGQKYPDDHAPSWTQGKTYVQAHIGATVTATIRPDEGYGIKNLNIIKQDHQPSTNLVDNGDGTYTFTMHDDESTHAYYSEVIGNEPNNAYYNTWVDVCPSFELLVSFSEGTSLTKTYGDDDFTLTGTLGTNVDAGGTWTWTSNDTSAIEIKNADTATPTLHINKASTVPVTVTATYKSYGTTVGTATIDVTVNPASVEVPTAATGLKWSGTEQTGVAEGAGYTVTDGKKTDAGNYTAIASLDSKTNYVWNDGRTADKSIEWSIAKADAVTIGDVKLYHYFNTMSQDVSASLAGKMPEDAGKLTYAAGTATRTGDLVVSNFTVDDNGNVSATLSGGQSGDTATLPVTISSKNYEDSTVNVIVTVTTKDDAGVRISEGSSLTKTYGDDDFTLTATASNPVRPIRRGGPG